MLTGAVGDLRRINHGLRPSVLDELGPVAAIRTVVDQLDPAKRGWITLHVEGPGRRLPEPVETVMFRVAQEALTNAVRHSGASKIAALLEYTLDEVRLSVTDNGIGMPALFVRQGLGIAGMRERAALVAGDLNLDSEPGQGVRVRLRIPVE